MTSLYLHGYNSTNQNDRTEWLQQFGTVVNPLMHYRNFPEDYRFIEKLLLKNRPDVIVASSMGGYFAYHLGNYYRIPTVLFNPALAYSHIIKPDNRQLATDTLHHICLGKNDRVIPPVSTLKALEQWRARTRIYTFDMGHETSFDVFLEVCQQTGLFG